jgi:hypothetical protein
MDKRNIRKIIKEKDRLEKIRADIGTGFTTIYPSNADLKARIYIQNAIIALHQAEMILRGEKYEESCKIYSH